MKTVTTIRVAMVAPNFPLREGVVNGGTEGVSYYLCSALRDMKGVELEIVKPFAPVTYPRQLTIAGISVHALSQPRWQPRHLYMLRTVQSQVRRKLDELQPDVVHVQCDAAIAAKVRQPCVFTLHGIVERDLLFHGSPLTRRLRLWVVNRVQKAARCELPYVIAISPYTRWHLGQNDQQRVWDIANPVAESFFSILRRPQAGLVLSPSHMIPLKNVATLVRAFADVARDSPAAQLRFAGSHQESSYGHRCRRLAADLGVASQVKFLGLLSIDRMQEELSRASIVALCSLQENAPLVIAEAMAAGVPVLASAVGGVPWMVTDGVTGRLIKPEDVDGIAYALRQMLTSDNLVQMGEAARRKAATTYRVSVVAEKTVQVYTEICERSRATVRCPRITSR